MTPPKYVRRFARIPIALEVLNATRHEGSDAQPMRLTDLAVAVGKHVGESVKPEELREDLLAYFTADAVLIGLRRDEVLEFLSSPEATGDDDVDPSEAEWVRVSADGSLDELGVEYVDAEEFGMLFMAAQSLLETEPDNTALREALEILGAALDGEQRKSLAPGDWTVAVDALRRGTEQRRKVRIVYSRMWREGITERVIEPYRLVQTRSGWEVDAGPADEFGRLRTFLVSHIREHELLDDSFERPADVTRMLEGQRETSRIRVQIPQDARWAADFFGSGVELVEDGDMVTLDVDLLPPLQHRTGLLLLAAGEDARVLDPAGLIASGPALARELLQHHRETGG